MDRNIILFSKSGDRTFTLDLLTPESPIGTRAWWSDEYGGRLFPDMVSAGLATAGSKSGRLLDVAQDLFSRYGYHAVGIDAEPAEAGGGEDDGLEPFAQIGHGETPAAREQYVSGKLSPVWVAFFHGIVAVWATNASG